MSYFTPEEVVGLDPELVSRLNRARGFAKIPFIITSGKRDGEANFQAGGKDNSAHLRGLAVDMACSTSTGRMKMVSALLLAGFTRIGVYNRHVHVDIDPTLPQDVMWVGESH